MNGVPDVGFYVINGVSDVGLYAMNRIPDVDLYAMNRVPDVGLCVMNGVPNVGFYAINGGSRCWSLHHERGPRYRCLCHDRLLLHALFASLICPFPARAIVEAVRL